MYAYYEVETNIPHNHLLHLQLPEIVPAGRAKVAVIYELAEKKQKVNASLKMFLARYKAEQIDIDTHIFDRDRIHNHDRDIDL